MNRPVAFRAVHINDDMNDDRNVMNAVNGDMNDTI
jgi:hypothetical protein